MCCVQLKLYLSMVKKEGIIEFPKKKKKKKPKWNFFAEIQTIPPEGGLIKPILDDLSKWQCLCSPHQSIYLSLS